MNPITLAEIDAQFPPLAIFPAQLSWTMAAEVAYADPPRQAISFVPKFPGCNANIAGTDVLWDVLALHESALRPGGHLLLNCVCGYAPDADIEAPVFVSHPDPETIIWEIDAMALRPALDESWHDKNGFLRLIFTRKEYEAEIRSMLRSIKIASSAGPAIETLDPDIDGDAYAQALALDSDGIWEREPILPPGTSLEFSFKGVDIFSANGQRDGLWPSHLFPAWSVHAAFLRWMQFVHRGFALKYVCEELGIDADLSRFSRLHQQDCFFLLHESERRACDQAGEEFVRLLAAYFAIGDMAPGVNVAYRPCGLPAVLP